jgi:hypothetical protein
MRLALRGICVRVRSAEATAAFKAVAPSCRTLGAVTLTAGDRYTHIGGRWYDEYDRVSACRIRCPSARSVAPAVP